MARIWGTWAQKQGIDGWVWDGAGSHMGEDMQGHQGTPCGATALRLKLSPVECFFQELRRAVEGRVYPTLQAKQEALEPILDVTQFESPLV